MTHHDRSTTTLTIANAVGVHFWTDIVWHMLWGAL
jgi:hypothetical protein